MQLQIESRSLLETRLDEVLMGDLVGPCDLGDGIEVVHDVDAVEIEMDCNLDDEPAPADDGATTIKFRRQTKEDHVATVKFARRAVDEPGELRPSKLAGRFASGSRAPDSKPFVMPVSKPSRRLARVVRASDAKATVRKVDIDTVPFVQYSAPYEKIEIEQDSKGFVQIKNEEVRVAPVARETNVFVRSEPDTMPFAPFESTEIVSGEPEALPPAPPSGPTVRVSESFARSIEAKAIPVVTVRASTIETNAIPIEIPQDSVVASRKTDSGPTVRVSSIEAKAPPIPRIEIPPVVPYSAPYERIDIQEDSKLFALPTVPTVRDSFTRSIEADLFAAYSTPEERMAKEPEAKPTEGASDWTAFVRSIGTSNFFAVNTVEPVRPSGSFEAAWFAESDHAISIKHSAPTTSRRRISVVTLIVIAFGLGAAVGLALFAL